LYIQHELSYDNFQAKGDRAVRVIMEYNMGGSVSKGNYTSTKVMPSFARNFPEVETGVRMKQTSRVVNYDDKQFNEKKFLYADSTFFRLFSFKLLKGNSNQVLAAPFNVVITASAAKKYFGKKDPLGKILRVGSTTPKDYQVTGLIEDCPSNSQIKFDFLASFSSMGAAQEQSYWDANYTTYLLLKNKASLASLQAKIPLFMKKEMAQILKGNDYITYELEPLKKVHLYSAYEGFEPNNSITYIYIIAAVAFLMLAIACFTYINLSTASSVERAKEVGIRKVVGAGKKNIFWQFISESFILTIVSVIISVVLALLLLPLFNQLAERQLIASSLLSPNIILFSLAIIICISLFAGSYPAFILSGFQPVKVLKGVFKNSNAGLGLRKSLIVFQFVISVFLIASTFIIQKQLHYIQNKNLGYNREHVIILPLDQKMQDNLSTIKTAFKSNPDVLNVATAVNDPSYIKGGYSMRRSDMPEGEMIAVKANPVDEEFVRATGLQIITGSDFTEQDIKDASNDDQSKNSFHFILNESAAKELGWNPQEAIGKKMFLGDQRPGEVKAVIKDFNFSSLHDPIKPLILFSDSWGDNLIINLSGRNLPQTISFLQAKWKSLIPHRPFEYTFLDENYNKLYNAELRTGKVLNIFSAIAIILACLGLFGLSTFAIQQRTKEIGIRKVLGASVSGLIALLSKDFLKLVIIAIVIALPIAWYFMNNWLQDFAYRVNISWWIFILSGAAALLIALITVSFQSIKAALANPVKNLRTE
ncbi:MAG: ABC transporter permease, partial [Chitinophagaceae bacterium]|nr:ABC transporter permease [Chitinophagaceae bacterium]